MRSSMILAVIPALACGGSPLSSACNHAIRIDLPVGGERGASWSSTHEHSSVVIDTGMATCVAAVSASAADRVSPQSYRIPVTVRLRLTVEDTTQFRMYRSTLSGLLDIEAVSDSGVVLGSTTVSYSPAESTPRPQLSGAITGLSSDDVHKTQTIRIRWHYVR